MNDDQINEKGRRHKMSEKYAISASANSPPVFFYFCIFSHAFSKLFAKSSNKTCLRFRNIQLPEMSVRQYDTPASCSTAYSDFLLHKDGDESEHKVD
jgi:hypothetical protein